MFGFLVGWGVFWLLLWLLITLGGYRYKSNDTMGFGILGSLLSLLFLVAVVVGRLAAGV
jgi:hypothetical protein